MGFSSGSSNQQSSSTGSSYGYNQSLAQSMNNIWGAQAAPLTAMYGSALGLQQQQSQTAPARANQLYGQVNPAAQFGLSQMQQFANPNSGLAARQLSDMSQQIGQNFQRDVMSGIRTGAGIGGNMGGSRMALAQGVAAGDAAQAIASAGTNIYGQQYAQAQQAAQALPGMAGQAFNLGMMPLQAAWAPLTSLASILGSPVALSQSMARSQAENMSASQSQSAGSSRQFGFNLW